MGAVIDIPSVRASGGTRGWQCPGGEERETGPQERNLGNLGVSPAHSSGYCGKWTQCGEKGEAVTQLQEAARNEIQCPPHVRSRTW